MYFYLDTNMTSHRASMSIAPATSLSGFLAK
jgi:hypothetical protein